MRTWFMAAGMALLGSLPGFAETNSGLRALVTANDTRGWEAVGRLDVGNTGFCTGALIAPDLVLTAAHCLYHPVTLERVDHEEIEFLAGFRNGRASAYRKVRAAVVHPDYVYMGPEGADHVADDIALIALDRPIQKSTVTPFLTGRRPLKGAEVQVVSYAHNRASRPSIEESCHVLGRPANTLVLSCDVDYGSSGAPVFQMIDGEPRIVSVISAKADVDGRPVSLGTQLETLLLDLQGRINGERNEVAPPQGPSVRSIARDSAIRGAGAKFLRP